MKNSLWRTLVLIISGLSVVQFADTKAGDEIPFSPFAFLPLREQNYQVSASAGVQPNIMFLIDDSGSMTAYTDGPNTYPNFHRADDYLPCEHEEVQNQMVSGRFVCRAVDGTLYPRRLRYRNRMDVVRDALYAVLDNPKFTDNFGWGLYTLFGTDSVDISSPNQLNSHCHYGNTNTRDRCPPKSLRMHSFGTAEEVKRRLLNISPTSNTPSTQAFLNVAEIVARNIKHVCQKSFIVMMSDGDYSNYMDDTLSPYQPPRDLAGYRNFYDQIPLHYPYGGQEPRLYNTDGDVVEEGDGISFFSRQLFYRDIKTAADGTDDEGIGWDQGVELTDENGDTQTLYTKQNIITYTVGFGDDLSEEGRGYLQAAASEPNGANGQFYFDARTPEELEQAFESIVGQAQTLSQTTRQSTSTATPSVAGSRSSGVPALAAFLDLDTKTWSSVLQFAELDADGSLRTDSTGQPIMRQVLYNNRKILVSDGSAVNFFADGPGYDYYGFKDKNEFDLGFTPWYLRDPDKSDEEIEQAVAAAVPAANRTVSEYRKRSELANDDKRMMGDVLDAPVLAIGEDEETKRDKYLVTAANDGMVYIFKAHNDEAHPYTLALNYLPAAMQRESEDDSDTVGKALKALAEAGYGKTYTRDLEDLSGRQPHLYLNNGGIQYRTTNKGDNDAQMTFAAGAMGRGGRGAYILAIGGTSRVTGNAVGLDADPQNWDQTVPLGETPKGSENKLGYTVGTPQIGRVAKNWTINADHREQSTPDIASGVRQYLFLANGYRPADTDIPYDEQPTLYVYEALGEELGTSSANSIAEDPGELITTIAVENGYGGLSTPVLVDTNLDGIFDHAYAGDQGGNLYRFTLIGEPGDWSVVKIYQGAVKDNGQGEELPYQPIATKPAVYRRSKSKYIVMAGTGSRIYQSDLENTDQQVVLGIFDDLSETPAEPVKQSQLIKQTILSTVTAEVNGNNETLRYLTYNTVSPTDKGWVLELGDQGERIVTDPSTLLSTGFFTTVIFNNAAGSSAAQTTDALSSGPSCKVQTQTIKTEAQSYLFAIDLKTGSNPSTSSARLHAHSKTNTYYDNAAAVQMSGTLSGVVIFSLSEHLKGPPSATDLNGAGQSGEDDVLGNNNEDREPVECLESDDYQVMVTGQDGLKVKQLAVPMCVATLIRVNWREFIP